MTKKYDEKEIRADYRRLTKLLIEKKLTITTMESATSGQIASLITDTEGSSAVLKRCVCYLLQRSENYAGRSGRNH